jgi:hypothetical protein
MRACFFLILTLLAAANARANDCDQITRANPGNPYAPVFRKICEDSDTRTQQAIAKIYGRPQPSTAVVELPGYGTDAAKKLGLACISGTAMRRLANGWEQLRDDQQRFLRCRAQEP